MRCSIHQPNYFSNQNYFDKIKASDIHVILDDCQFEKNGFTNRNKIPNNKNDLWLTIPIVHSLGQRIKDVKTLNDIWINKHKNTLLHRYTNDNSKEFINDFFDYENAKLINWTVRSLIHVISFLEIDFKIITSSQLHINTTGSQRLIDICKEMNCDTYISGQGGKKYLDEKLFESNRIAIEYMPSINAPYSILDTILK